MKSRGAGDTLYRVIRLLGITRIIRGCASCERRRKALNRLIPYRSPR